MPAHPKRHHALPFGGYAKPFHIIILVTLLLTLVTPSTVCTPREGSSTFHLSQFLDIYALNANGLQEPMKLTNINNLLRARAPHIVLITETKLQTRCSAALPNYLYKFFETGQPCANHHIAKWRIVFGVRRASIQVQRRIDIHSDLKGRVIALDTVLMTTAGSAVHLRIVRTYTPHDPGGNHGNEPDIRFWGQVTDICMAAQHAWIAAGNTNTTLTHVES